MTEKLELTDDQWRERLSPEQYQMLREGGTERAFTGKYDQITAEGCYLCAGCGTALFGSDAKYDADTGWPSYTEPLTDGLVLERPDLSHGIDRTQVRCATCEGHLGHVFPDGPGENGLRYCMNSAALAFEPGVRSC